MQNKTLFRTLLSLTLAAGFAAAPAGALAAREAKERPPAGNQSDFIAARMLEKGKELLSLREEERGVKMLETLIEQYPASPVRFQAYLELGKHYLEVNKQPTAIIFLRKIGELTQDLAPEEKLQGDDRDLYLEALYLTGTAYFEMRQYSASFPVLRKITVEYPNTIWANQAYYYIGMCHFAQGNWSKAIKALSLVGTFIDPDSPTVEFTEAGRRFYVKIEDADLPVLNRLGKQITATIRTESGDIETVECIPLTGSDEQFIGSISTELGAAKPDDKVLQVVGGDKITTTYADANTREGKPDVVRKTEATVVSTAVASFTLGDFETQASAAFLGSPVFVRLLDADLDTSPSRDSVEVRVLSRYKQEFDEGEGGETGSEPAPAPESPAAFDFSSLLRDDTEQWVVRDEVVVTLGELGEAEPVRTGKFGGQVPLVRFRESDAIDRNDQSLVCALNDQIVITYTDERHIQGSTPREVTAEVSVASEVSGKPSATQYVVSDPVVRSRRNLVEAQAYLELARIFKSMGLSDGANEKAAEGLRRVDEVIKTRSPIPPELSEQAFKIKWELYLARNDLRNAIATCQLFNRLYPNSPFVDQALMGIAQIKLENNEFDEAINILRQVLRLTSSTSKAEAQYLIAQTYEQQQGDDARGQQQAIMAYKQCAERYPDSAFAGESLAKVVDYYIQTRDYTAADDLLEQIFQDYPDASFLDAMLLKWVMVAYRMGNFEKAHEKCSQLVFDYPGSNYAEKAKEILPKIEAKVKQ